MEKPANQDLSQAITAPFVSADFESLYESYMDMMLIQLGRTITLYMPPAIQPSVTNPDQYNPWTREKDRRLGGDGEGVNGSIITPITVQYTAHVVHGPKSVTPDVPWDLNAEDVMLSLTIGALEDVKKAVEIEVDGVRYVRKAKDIRQYGLTTPKYILTSWSRKVAD